MITLHSLKLSTRWFDAKIVGLKPWELRFHRDRTFNVGDFVIFNEVNGDTPTGRSHGPVEITWIMFGGRPQDEFQNASKLLDEDLCIFTHGEVVNAD